MFDFLDGYKTHILGGLAILLGLVKFITEIPEIEAINVLGVTDPWALITAGWAVISGRSAIKKLEGK